MAGLYLSLREELGPAVEGAWGATVSRLWSHLVLRSSPVAGRDTLPDSHAFRARIEQGMGCV